MQKNSILLLRVKTKQTNIAPKLGLKNISKTESEKKVASTCPVEKKIHGEAGGKNNGSPPIFQAPSPRISNGLPLTIKILHI